MLISAITERLRMSLGHNRVFGASDFLQAKENTAYTETPTYFVIPSAEQAEDYNGDEAFNVNRNVTIIALLDVAKSDFRGERAIFETQGVRQVLFNALFGWQPAPNYHPTKYVSADFQEPISARVFYGFTFSFSEQIEPSCFGGELDLQTPNFEVRPNI